MSPISVNRGYIGRSQGCPAVPMEEAEDIIDVLKEGACLFIYPGNRRYVTPLRPCSINHNHRGFHRTAGKSISVIDRLSQNRFRPSFYGLCPVMPIVSFWISEKPSGSD